MQLDTASLEDSPFEKKELDLFSEEKTKEINDLKTTLARKHDVMQPQPEKCWEKRHNKT